MRAIAQACGLRLSNVQYYFSSLEELFCTMLEFIFQDTKSRLEQLVAEGNDLLDALFYIIFHDIEQQTDCQLLFEIWSISAQFEKTNDIIVELYRSYLDALTETIMSKNHNLSKVQAQKRAEAIVPMFEGLCIVYGKGRKQILAPELEKSIKETIQTIINAK